MGKVLFTGRRGSRSFKKKTSKVLSILVTPDQFAHILTGRAITTRGHLLLDEGFQRTRE